MILALNLKVKKNYFFSTLLGLLRNSGLPFRPCILDEIAPKADPEVKMWVERIHLGWDPKNCREGVGEGDKQKRESSEGCINDQGRDPTI